MPRSRTTARSGRALAALVAALVVSTAVVTVAAPAPARALDSPSGLDTSEATHPVLSWARVPGASGYDVELSRTAEFTAATRVGSVVSTVNVSYVPTVQLPADGVWWRVRAKSGSVLSDYATASFAPAATRAPELVRPLPDARFRAPQAPSFTWQPVAGATSYTVQTSRDPQFIDPAGIAQSTQKTTAAYLSGYPTAGGYFWRVRAELSSGYWSAWSDPSPYVVDGLPAVQRTSPDDTFATSVRDVVLDWEPVSGAVTYELQVNTDDAFGTATELADETGIVSTRWSPPRALNNDEYYWRVRAVDASGVAAPWPATPWHLRRAWPDQPTTVHPRGTADPATPFFYEWTAIERASKYTVLLYDSNGAKVCSRETVHTTLAGYCVPDASGDYSWQVLATDAPSGTITDLIAQPQTTFHYEQPAATTPAPAGTLTTAQVTGHATSITGTAALDGPGQEVCEAVIPATCVDLRQTPVLTWDPVPGATYYRLTLARDRELTNKVSGYDGVAVDQPMFTFDKSLPDGQAGSAYFWVVQPCGQTCAPIAHSTTSFAKKSLPPQLVSPAPDALVADDVTLDWGSELDALRAPRPAGDTSSLVTPAATEAQTYTVQTSTDPTFASYTESTVDETELTAPTATYPEGYVYWRVRANDGSGNPSVWSEVRRFEKRSPRPGLLTPTPGAELGNDMTFSWEPLAFAATYDLEVYAGAARVANPTRIKYTSWTPTSPLQTSSDTFTWRVRRVDAKNRAGEWSSWRPFVMSGFPLSLAAPDDGATVAPSGALFSWLPDPRATSYRFERRKPGDTSLAETVPTRATAWAPTVALPAGTAQWRVVALDTAGKDLGSSPWRTFVVVDPPATATPVTISGSGKVGTELRLSAPTFDPAAETTTYQWYRGSSAIGGAVGETYTLVSGDSGKAITVRATGTLAGYKSATTTSNAITGVVGDALVAAYPPAIDGEPRVGQSLSVLPAAWPEPTQTRRYQWYRDGQPISRASATTYRLAVEDQGHQVHVVETATAPGRQPGTSASDVVTVAAPQRLGNLAPPTISGQPVVGRTLTAGNGRWEETPSFAWQWYRNGVAIAGATRQTYTLSATDAARRVHVVVTASETGYTPGTAASSPVTVGKLASTTALSLSRTTATTKQRVTATVTVSASGVAAPGGTVTVYDGARKLAKVSLRGNIARVRLPALKAGKHTVKAVYSGGAQVKGSSRSVRLTVTKPRKR